MFDASQNFPPVHFPLVICALLIHNIICMYVLSYSLHYVSIVWSVGHTVLSHQVLTSVDIFTRHLS